MEGKKKTKTGLRDAAGKPAEIAAVSRDIAEHKKYGELLEIYRYMVESARDAIFYKDLDSRYVAVNNKVLEAFGLSRDEVIGRNDLETMVDQEEARGDIEVDRFVFTTGQLAETTRVMTGADGSQLWVNVIKTPYYDDDGNVIGLIGIARDITERKKMEEITRRRLEFEGIISTVSSRFVAPSDIDDAINQSLAEIGSFGGAHRAYLFLFREDGVRADNTHEWCAEGVHPVIEKNQNVPTEQMWWMKHIKQGEVVPIEGVSKMPAEARAEKAMLEDQGIKSMLLAPVYDSSGKIFGFMGFDNVASTGRWPDDTITALRLSSEIIGNAIERNRAEKALQDAAQQWRTTFDAIGDAVCLLDIEGKILRCNEAMTKLTGKSFDEVKGSTCWEIMHEAAQPPENCPILRIGKTHLRETWVAQWQDQWLQATTDPLLDDEGNLIGAVHIMSEVSERKRAEQALRESEEFSSSLLIDAPNPIYVVNPDTSIRYVNPALEKLTGYSAVELIGREAPYPWWPKDKITEIARRMKGDHKVGLAEHEETFQNSNGEPFIVDILSIPIIYDGEFRYYLLNWVDVTERRWAEQALRESEEFSSSLLIDAPNPILVINPDTSIKYVNPALEKLTGYSAVELIGREAPYPWWPKKEAPEILEDLRKAMNQGTSMREQVYRKKGGESFIIEINSKPVAHEGGLDYLLVNWVDLTERKQAEAEKLEMERRAQTAGRLATVGEMASGIAHEINNPLTGVIGFSQLLMNREIPEDIKDQVEVIYEGGQRVASIVNRLLTFARQHKPERAYTNINQVIKTTLSLLAYEMESNKIKVSTELVPELPRTMADSGQLQQVFLNIILNAQKEMMFAHGRGNLLIRTERFDDIIQISFKDDGPGIAKGNLVRIFDPFFTTREVGEGTGLGLSVCHGIITEHRGKIYAKSQRGRGATFVIELPIVGEDGRPAPAPADVEHLPEVTRARILVVDDEPLVRRFLSELIAGEGHEVDTVDSGTGALEKLKTERYNLILLDIKLPDMSGIEVYQKIQDIAYSLARRVVFITGDVMGRGTSDFLSKVKNQYITKPFDSNKLRQELRRILTEGR